MAKKKTPKKKIALNPKKSPPVRPGPDPRFEPVLKALKRRSGFSLMQDKSGAMRGLMLNGKSFGMSSHGRFIVKLDEPRVAALIATGIGKPFAASAKRVLKAWVEITDPKADWVALGKEALRLMASAGKPKKG